MGSFLVVSFSSLLALSLRLLLYLVYSWLHLRVLFVFIVLGAFIYKKSTRF